MAKRPLMRKGERETSGTHRGLASFGCVRASARVRGGLCAHALVCKGELPSPPPRLCADPGSPGQPKRGLLSGLVD